MMPAAEAKKNLKHLKQMLRVNPHSKFFAAAVRWHEIYIRELKHGSSKRDAHFVAYRETGYLP